MKRLFLGIFILLFSPGMEAQQLYSFIFGGIERTYRVHLPTGYAEGEVYPLVINMHGLGSNSFQQEFYSEFDQVADTAGIVMAYPDGVENQWNIYQDGGVDDVGFISALIDTMHANYNIDLDRVYACGMSMGGFMSHRLGCQLNDRIAAIGSVTGLLVYFNCNFTRKIPVLQVHGTADDIVPYDGVAYTIQYWTMNNFCPDSVVTDLPDVDTTDQSTVTLTTYSPCSEDTEVLLYTINGGGHTWPGASYIIGVTNQDIHASVELWNFFKKYTLSAGVGIQNVNLFSESIKVYPQPAHHALNLEFDSDATRLWNVSIYEITGRKIWSESYSSDGRIMITNLNIQPGMYVLELVSGQTVYRQKVMMH